MDTAGKKASNFLAPGFRFHPTDEELVRYYLRRKVCRKNFQVDAVTEIDIYKVEPWDLPGMSKLKSRDLEWYFFSALDKKYGNGAKTNRATEKGYWKTTGKDRPVYHKNQIVGMKKTLVFHIGRPPKGQRSNWVMHEYRLTDLELEGTGISQDAFVVCRVHQKSGSGPKNGEQYGAPFVEEEWETDEFDSVMKKEVLEEINFDNDAYLDGHELEQILGSGCYSDTVPPLDFPYSAGSHYGEETTESVTELQNLINANETAEYNGLHASLDANVNLVKNEFIGESSKSGNNEDIVYLLDEPFLDSFDYLPNIQEGFIETNDFSNPVDDSTLEFDLFEEYLTYFDVNDSSIDANINDFPEKVEETEQCITTNEQITDSSRGVAPPPPDELKSAKSRSVVNYSFMQRTSEMLGNIPAPPAFAAEFPSKNSTALQYSSSSSSVHVTAGLIQIQNLTVGANGPVPSSLKQGGLNIIFSFGLSNGLSSLESSICIHPGKTHLPISRDWYYFYLQIFLFLATGFKIVMYVANKVRSL